MKNQSDKQQGVGLVEILIATFVLVIISALVAKLILSPKKAQKKVTSSTQCISIATSLMSELVQESNFLALNNIGPGVNGYPSQIKDAYGSDRFSFLQNSSDTSSQPSLVDLNGAPTIYSFSNSSDVAERVVSNWKLNNFMNLENSFTRLLPLVNRVPAMCVTGLEANSGQSVGVSFRELAIPKLNELLQSYSGQAGFDVKVAVDILDNNNSICSQPIKVARPQNGLPYAIVQVTVEMPTGTDSEQEFCSTQGRAYFPRDDAPPLTALVLKTNVCASGKPGPGVICGEPTDRYSLDYDVYTVLDTPQCRACLTVEAAKECPARGDQSQCMINGACRYTDAGSVYLCKVGGRNWFLNSMKQYEPCDYAKVYDEDGSPTNATIKLDYINDQNTEGGRARLKIEGLPPDRVWMVDVRAIDISGQQAGPSFCGASGICTDSTGEIITSASPQLNNLNLRPFSDVIARSWDPPRDGTVSNSDAQHVFSGYYQCNMANGQLIGFSRFAGRPAFSDSSGPGHLECSVTMSGGTATCLVRRNGWIRVSTSPSGPDGDRLVRLNLTDYCGRTSTTNFRWCIDSTETYTMSEPTKENGVSPNNLKFKSNPNVTKACDLVFKCPAFPQTTGQLTYQLNGCSPQGYEPIQHSGCEKPDLIPNVSNSQLCLRVIDPCGRAVNTPSGQYEIFLANSTAAQTTAHLCRKSFGNDCFNGYCTNDYKCMASCSFLNKSCTSDDDCRDGTVCGPNQGRCISGNCRCPTNSSCNYPPVLPPAGQPFPPKLLCPIIFSCETVCGPSNTDMCY